MVSVVSSEDLSPKRNRKFWGIMARFLPPLIYEILEIIYNLYGYLKLSKEVKSFKPDFIYERYSLYNFSGILTAKKWKIPLILEVNSPIAYEKKKYGRLNFPILANRLEKWIFTNASKTIVVSNVLKKYLININVPAEKLEIIPNGINPLDFKEEDVSTKDTIRKRYGIEDKIIIGFVGWIREWHKLDMLLEILENMDVREKKLHLLIVGEGPGLDSLKKYIAVHSLSRMVTFSGPIPHNEVKKYISTFDIALIVDCTFYCSPMKLFEYMAMGKAIIAPRMENIEEVLTEGKNCILFKPEDKDDLKKSILTLASDPQLREKIGIEAKHTIYEKEYFWKNNAKKVIRIYNECSNKYKEV